MSIVVFSNDKCCIQTKTILKTIFKSLLYNDILQR